MTTVAFKDGVLASDSRCSEEDGLILTTIRKVFKLKNGAFFGGAGDSDDRQLRELLGQKKLPSKQQIQKLETEVEGILILPTGLVYVIECEYNEDQSRWFGAITEIEDRMVAVGTGKEFAYGAMEAGKSATEAVVIACRRDFHSAGPVQTINTRVK